MRRHWPPEKMDDWEMFPLATWLAMNPSRYKEQPHSCNIRHKPSDGDSAAAYVYAWMGTNEVEELALCEQHAQETLAHRQRTDS